MHSRVHICAYASHTHTGADAWTAVVYAENGVDHCASTGTGWVSVTGSATLSSCSATQAHLTLNSDSANGYVVLTTPFEFTHIK